VKKILSLILTLTVFLFAAYAIAKEQLSEEFEIYEKTLRLHVPANSDSAEDQEVKLKVRDAVINYLAEPMSDCRTKDEAVQKIQDLTTNISLVANNILKDNGFDYTARISVVKENYPTRDYEGISLPAGEYTSLKIELGKAEGQNWWCVLFPQVCIGTSKPAEALAEVGFTPNQIRLLTDADEGEYVVKFKLLEIISSLAGGR
jgi:stage II sporulation protein R